MSYETILVETQGPVTIIRLNRPQALNALNSQVLTDLIDAQHSKRIEIIITLLIVSEVVLSLFQIWADRGH